MSQCVYVGVKGVFIVQTVLPIAGFIDDVICTATLQKSVHAYTAL